MKMTKVSDNLYYFYLLAGKLYFKSEWLLLHVRWAFFQLYHGGYKLHW